MKNRLDLVVSERYKLTRTRAQTLIKDGKVMVEGIVITKPSFEVCEEVQIVVDMDNMYVSRGAYKLVGASERFGLCFEGRVALDMGASTGGFTQVLLQGGATKVYAVDVGHGELDASLACDERVVNMEGRDIRGLVGDELPGVDLVVGDLSFISLKNILPKINQLFGKIECILLFKPQFECGKEIARKYRGVIKDKVIHKRLLREFLEELKIYGYEVCGLCHSPIKGKEGNIEYLLHLNACKKLEFDVDKVVENAFKTI